MANNVQIKTPHAAVVVWNYNEKLGSEQSTNTNAVNEIVISTLSLMGVSTSKSKGTPVGRFELTLAPTKNWVATLTPGSWLCIMMSQNPITKEDLPSTGSAKPDKVKMIGKIESVRLNTTVDPQTGARQTTYSVIGVDWAYIFENFIYLDPFIDPDGSIIGSATFLEIFGIMQKENGDIEFRTVDQLLNGIIDIIGKPLTEGTQGVARKSNRLAKSTFAFQIPPEMVNFLNIKKYDKISKSNNVVDLLSLYTGKLARFDDPKKNTVAYQRTDEAVGYIDPVSFKGTNTLWQLLIDNGNQALNEMFTGMRWNSDGTMSLALYNRIRPFIFKGAKSTSNSVSGDLSNSDSLTESQISEVTAEVRDIFSRFQNIRRFKIPVDDIVDINAGTNWRDKYNFVEIKPSFQDARFLSTWIKSVAQTADENAFAREGFRPLIVSTKQIPSNSVKGLKKGESQNTLNIDYSFIAGWKELLRLWYFDTHKMLNGTLTISGQNSHIEVGDNILIDVKALGITANINSNTKAVSGKGVYVMAHIENIEHDFRVSPDGARTYITRIQFVRGITTNDKGQLIGTGTLDNLASALTTSQKVNDINVFGTPSGADPKTNKPRGS